MRKCQALNSTKTEPCKLLPHLTKFHTFRGPIAAVVLCFTPVLFLLATTLYKPLFLRSSLSLPLSALLLAFVRLAYLSSPALLVLAHVAVGALQGLVPLAVTFGAILLFEVMAATGCLQYMMGHVRRLSAGNRVAEVFLIGWAFAYTISGEKRALQARHCCKSQVPRHLGISPANSPCTSAAAPAVVAVRCRQHMTEPQLHSASAQSLCSGFQVGGFCRACSCYRASTLQYQPAQPQHCCRWIAARP